MKQNFLARLPWRHLQRVAGILLGTFITALSLNTLIVPNKIADGGITGIAILLHYLLDWPISWMVFALNVPLFLVGLKMVGRTFLIYSVIGVTGISIALEQTSHLPAMTNDILLASIFGGVLAGIGMGIIFRSRGSLGGTDIIAVFLSHRLPFSVGQVLLGIDAVIFVVAAVLISPETAMYAMIYMFVATKVIDLVQEGMNHSKSVMVMSSKPQAIARDIMEKLERGVTLFSAVGAYSGEDKQVVYCVISRTELSQVKEIIHQHDPQAFLTISEVPEVVGEGFSPWKGH